MSLTLESIPDQAALELRERIDILEYVTAKYSGTFERVADVCSWLATYECGCVLFDFDVIKNYIISGVEHPTEILALEYFLDNGSMDFAFPGGTFSELAE